MPNQPNSNDRMLNLGWVNVFGFGAVVVAAVAYAVYEAYQNTNQHNYNQQNRRRSPPPRYGNNGGWGPPPPDDGFGRGPRSPPPRPNGSRRLPPSSGTSRRRRSPSPNTERCSYNVGACSTYTTPTSTNSNRLQLEESQESRNTQITEVNVRLPEELHCDYIVTEPDVEVSGDDSSEIADSAATVIQRLSLSDNPNSVGECSRSFSERYDTPVKAEDTNESEICPICRMEMECEKNTATLPCGHKFHFVCVNKWFRYAKDEMIADKSDLCPVCRQSIDNFEEGKKKK